MNKYLSFILLSLIISQIPNAEAKESDPKVFKNKKFGYEFSYPSDWYPVASDEPDEITGIDIPVDEAAYITMYLTPEKRKLCKYDPDCNLTIMTSGDGTKAGYKESIDYVNNFEKYEKTMNPPKTRIQESELNGHKIEIVLRESSIESFNSNTYLYCNKVLFLFTFAARKKYLSTTRNIITDFSKPVSLETMYNPEQLLIIKSFKCPDPDYNTKKTNEKKIGAKKK